MLCYANLVNFVWVKIMTHMVSFEYKLINIDHVPNSEDEKLLNQLGEEGWEIVSMTPSEQKINGWVDGVYQTVGEIEGGITTLSILLKREKFSQKVTYDNSIVDKRQHGSVEELFDFTKYVPISQLCSSKNLSSTGLYSIRLAVGKSLPEKYAPYLKEHRIIYIGQSSVPLYERFWKQELNAEGHGTFFRSIGAMLGYLPPKGSLLGKETRNYKFSSDDELLIKKWMEDNLVVNCISLEKKHLDELEQKYIIQYRPLLNIKHNPDALVILSEARDKCVKYAKQDGIFDQLGNTSVEYHKFEFKGLRSALEENIKLQNKELQKGNDAFFCVTDINSNKDNLNLPQVVSDDFSNGNSNYGGAKLTIFVPFGEDNSYNAMDFKNCKVSRQFQQMTDDQSFYYCVGNDIDAAMCVLKDLLNEFYRISDDSSLTFETWIDN